MEFVGIINEKQFDITTDLRVIKRKNHINNIFSLIERKYNEVGFKSIVLTGDSGSGKSILISMLKDYLENKKYSVELKRDFNTFDIPSNKQIILLDQFENVLNCINFINKIKEYSKENDCIFVFSFPQSYLSRMSNLFVSNKIDNALKDIYVLSLNDDDIQQYKRKISNFCNIEEIYIDNYINKILKENSNMQSGVSISIECKKLCDALIKVIKGKSPLIELELLGYILSFNYGNDKRFSKEYSFIDVPLDDWVNRFLHKETAYSILYLMSEFKTFNIDDIRMVTFREREHYEYDIQNKKDGLLLKSLKDNPFIYTGNNYNSCRAKHQYISEQFRRYCQDKEIPEGVRNYIPHLIRCIDNKNNENSEYSYKKLDENYNRYYSNHTGILIVLILMFIGVLAINVIQINEPVEVHWQLFFNSLISLPSIYYIYNYCKRFFLISNNIMATFTYVAGAIGIVASYFFIDLWGMLFGVEIIILAISIGVAYHNKKSRTINRIFFKDFCVFGAIGVVISLLGIIFFFLFSPSYSYEQTSIPLIFCKYSYYCLFLIYSLLSVINHIKYSYIIGRIGLSNIVK
ncbi:MAG: ATP-binding protein [Ruminococcus flavefaciens]|nr:ATP-binding protein [Ruminococcus flavefaciens]